MRGRGVAGWQALASAESVFAGGSGCGEGLGRSAALSGVERCPWGMSWSLHVGDDCATR